jgi:transposase
MLPDNAGGQANGRASPIQLRKWQLEQIAAIIKDVDKVCYSEDAIPLSDALENRVLPWLQKLSESISLWHETVMAGFRLGISNAVS